MTSKIKPCPFCGTSMRVATEYMFTHPGTFGEGECLLAGLSYYWEHIDWWNTRQSTADLQAKLDMAVEALEEVIKSSDQSGIPGYRQCWECADTNKISKQALAAIKGSSHE